MNKWYIRRVGIASFLFTFLFLSISTAELAGKLTYSGLPEDLDGNTYDIPSQAVYMSEEVVVGQPSEVIEGIIDASSPPSIFFVIDHSGSMYAKKYDATDQWGNRFIETKNLLDTIYEIYPNAEVGISVFAKHLYFDVTDDQNFSNVTGYSSSYYEGGYISILQLDKVYPSAIGDKTGYEILSHYLQTDTSNAEETSDAGDTYLNLKYRPTDTKLAESSTNITASFDAVKHAFQKTNRPAKDQYVVFFSDGVAMAPSDNTIKNKFEEGDSIPTTFTIFFTEQQGVPPSIETMTKNIQENNYSENNPKSKNWPFDNVNNSNNLTAFLIDSVFSLITTTSNSKPLKITINDTTENSTSIEVNNKFLYTFSSLFPFTGADNNFKYEILYEVNIPDSIDTTIIHKTQETIKTEFSIHLDDAATIVDSNFTLEYWDRSIKFYDEGGTEITTAYEAVQNLDLRFEVSKEDILYDYENVKLEVIAIDSNIDINSGNLISIDTLDHEILTLTSKSSSADSEIFGISVPLTLDNYTKKNNKLETDGDDNFLVIFRNSNKVKLPLDTLITNLPYRITGAINIESAFYFDKKLGDNQEGADGLIDSIYITLRNNENLELDNNDLTKIMENLVLPSYRNFQVLDSSISNNSNNSISTISLKVKELAERNNTSIHAEDIIRLNQVILDSGFVSKSSTIPIDSMAPVIVSASAIQYEVKTDSTKDMLTVRFSEPVEDINEDRPFLLFDFKNDQDYNGLNISFIENKTDVNIVTFYIDQVNKKDGTDRINRGDSIWINTLVANPVTDGKVTQYESNNIRRVLSNDFVEKPFDIKVKVTGPIDFIDPNEGSKIDDDIIGILKEENKKLLIEKDGDFHGMLIIGETIQEGTDGPENIELKGTFAVYDCIGNAVWDASEMSFDPATKTLYYVWNGKNTKGRIVGSGAYISLMIIETVDEDTGEVTEKREIKKYLNVKTMK